MWRDTSDVGELVTEERAVALDGARSVRAALQIGSGELAIGGGGRELLDATFSYNVPGWRPELTYAVRGGGGELAVWQPTEERPRGVANAKNRWDLRFAGGVPLDLDLQAGAVEGKLYLGGLALERANLKVGTGNFTLDLSELRARDLSIAIKCGVLNLKVIVPRDLGTEVEAHSPVMSMHAKDWRRSRHTWVNEAHDGAAGVVRIAVASGVASITLTQHSPATQSQPVVPLLH